MVRKSEDRMKSVEDLGVRIVRKDKFYYYIIVIRLNIGPVCIANSSNMVWNTFLKEMNNQNGRSHKERI